MTFEIEEALLSLAAAVQADGGERLLATATRLLGEAAPFDAAELLLRPAEGGVRRFALGQADEPLTGPDLLQAVLESAEPLRVDHLAEATRFPDTHARMEAWGAASLLALRLGEPGTPAGAVVFYRRHGWGFVGASWRTLRPLVRMTGVSLAHALAFDDPGRRAPGPLEVAPPAAPSVVATAPLPETAPASVAPLAAAHAGTGAVPAALREQPRRKRR